MKNSRFLILLVIFSSLLFSACSTLSQRTVSETSSMIRTVGIGENSMPIDEGSYTLEFFNDEAIAVDMINETFIIYYGENSPENEHYISGKKTNQTLRTYGFNLRYGIDKYTELKLGYLTGEIKNGYSSPSPNSNTINKSYTSLTGIQLGLKRLLTEYNNPHRLSLYADGKYFITSSESVADKYDGSNLEVKSALIYGYLSNPDIRSFPSIALYYSLAKTKRDNTIEGIPLKQEIRAYGLETNYTINMGPLYPIFSLGVEKDVDDSEIFDDLNYYFGVKLGLYFHRHK